MGNELEKEELEDISKRKRIKIKPKINYEIIKNSDKIIDNDKIIQNIIQNPKQIGVIIDEIVVNIIEKPKEIYFKNKIIFKFPFITYLFLNEQIKQNTLSIYNNFSNIYIKYCIYINFAKCLYINKNDIKIPNIYEIVSQWHVFNSDGRKHFYILGGTIHKDSVFSNYQINASIKQYIENEKIRKIRKIIKIIKKNKYYITLN